MAMETTSVVPLRNSGSVSTRDVVEVLYRKRYAWLGGIAIWLAVVGLWAWWTPDRYDAETVLLVKNDRANMVLSPEELARTQGDQKDSQIATEVELLAQQDLLRQVVRDTGAGTSAKDVDEAVRKLRKNLEITPVFKADLIRIRYNATSRADGTKVLSALVRVYMDRHLQIHHSGDALPFFDQQADNSARELRRAEDKLASYENRTGIVLINEQKQAAVTSISDLEAESRKAAVDLDEARKQVELLSRRKAGLQERITTQKRSIPNQYSVERLNTMLTELQNKRTELLAKFRPEDRLVRETDDQIANTKSALTQAQSLSSTEESTDVNPLHQAVDKELAAAQVAAKTARIRHDLLATQIRQQQEAMAGIDSATTEHDNLEREVKRQEENYRLYSSRREEARIADVMDQKKIANVAVAEAPMVPALPKPKVSGGLAGTFFLGCAVILSATIAVGGRRRTFETPWELEAYTVMPVLAIVGYRDQFTEGLRHRIANPLKEPGLSGGN